MRSRWAIIIGCAAVLLGACGPGPVKRSAEQASSDAAFGWKTSTGRLEQGSLQVPVDYADPSKGTFTLNVVRRLATNPSKRIGSLLVNPGGPGFGGSELAQRAEVIYSLDILERFDIVGWDPRGTGLSEPHVDCITDYDHYYGEYDITPDNNTERKTIVDLAKEFAGACNAANADILQYVGTNNSARDIDAVRRALGEDTISYFGFSYGSVLGATWATLFPDTVRAAVLDGAADPNADPVQAAIQQSKGFEHTLTTFLAGCSANMDCPFYNNGAAEQAFDALMLQLDEQPIPGRDGRPPLTRAMAITAVAQGMYSSTLWPRLATVLSQAQAGDGSGLMGLYDQYYGRLADGTYGNELEAFQVITCMDSPTRLTVQQEDDASVLYRQASPRLAPGTTGAYGCVFFPPSVNPRMAVTGAGAGPILVMGTTGDAATPLDSTRAMAATLDDGRLVIVTADQHTGYNVNQCSRETIDRYLIDPLTQAPKDGTTCS